MAMVSILRFPKDRECPNGGLHRSENNGEPEADTAAAQKALGLFPGVDSDRNRRHSGEEEGDNGEVEGDAVIERATILEVREFSFSASALETGGANVLAFEFNIAQGAKEASAPGARDGGALLRMVKTTGFALHEDGLAGLANSQRPECGGIKFGLHLPAARRKRLGIGDVDSSIGQGRSAAGTWSGVGHGCYRTRITRVFAMWS